VVLLVEASGTERKKKKKKKKKKKPSPEKKGAAQLQTGSGQHRSPFLTQTPRNGQQGIKRKGKNTAIAQDPLQSPSKATEFTATLREQENIPIKKKTGGDEC